LAHRLHREGRLDRVTPGEELPVPPGVRVVLGLKLHDLDDACRRALAVAAVAGLVCSVDVVASVQLANAALGLSGAGFEVALFDAAQCRLLEEALGTLGDREPALRSRLSARLAVALSLAGEDARRVELSESAVDLAVQAGDGAARGAALAARCDARAGPEDIDRRTEDAAEIVRAARAAAEPGLELTGRRPGGSWRWPRPATCQASTPRSASSRR
jgi:hypothetical protein